MKMAKLGSMVNLLVFGLVVTILVGSGVEGLGVNWGTISSHRLPSKSIVQMLKDNGIKKVKLFDVDQSALEALAGSGIEVMVAVTNLELQAMNDPTNATKWVKDNVIKYVDQKVNITNVAIGNEPFLKDYKDRFVNVTLPALKNIQKALNDAKLGDKIKATVPLNGDVYESPSWNPVPSAGEFRPDIANEVGKIADFLEENNAPFVVNIYPFLSLYMSKGAFPIDYAFFDGATGITDGDIQYTNVFDANYDTCVSALNKAGHGNMTVVVGEIGWPTDGNGWANNTVASRFYNGLLPRLAANKGTPLRPGYIEVYLFSLLDEDAKSVLPGDFERHWGIFDFAGQPKFPMDFAGKDKNKTLVGAKGFEYQPKKWCVLKPNASKNETKIEANTDYACDHADCTAMADGGSCDGLTDDEKKSFAFNQYFQVANQTKGSCDFEGLAMEVTTDPSKGTCKFNIQVKVEEPVPPPTPAPAPGSRKGEDETGAPPESSAAAVSCSSITVALVVSGIVSFLFS